MNKHSTPSKKKYTIGTRGSLLALTQCNQIKKILEQKTGDDFRLKIIKTEGDLKTEKPLWQMDGKDFFTKELDHALLHDEIDLVVHSYKDLGSERPEGIKLGAITKRAYPHDILLIDKDIVKQLQTNTFSGDLIIGTSSPRRIYNIENFLKDFIPGNPSNIKTKQLRGNVNTRIGKLVAGEYHGIVLALPGLERLAMTKSSADEIKLMLETLTFSVLPTSKFPAAASQGALGIEFNQNRKDNGELEEKLSRVHDETTADAVKIERAHFQQFGGGCHLAVGITTRHANNHLVTSMRGSSNGETIISNQMENIVREKLNPNTAVFIGVNARNKENTNFTKDELLKRVTVSWKSRSNAPKYVTTKYAAKEKNSIETLKKSLVFTAGSKTWQDLVRKGIWVHGSADALGEDELQALKASRFLSLITNVDIEKSWTVLSHKNALTELGDVVESYASIEQDVSESFKQEISRTQVFFWSSFRQYETYLRNFPNIKDQLHCCGLGKTYLQFKEKKINVIPFSGMREFKNWANLK